MKYRIGIASARIFRLILILLTVQVSQLTLAQQSASGNLWNDLNADGVRQFNELGMKFKSVLAVGAGPFGQTHTAMADLTGRFRFVDLPQGSYQVFPITERTQTTTFPREAPWRTLEVTSGPEITGLDYGVAEGCGEFEVNRITCEIERPGCFRVEVEITNNSSYPLKHAYFLGHNVTFVGQTADPGHLEFNPAIGVGETKTYQLWLCDALPEEEYEITVTFHGVDFELCCTSTLYFHTPSCDCMQILRDHVTCQTETQFSWQFSLQSLYAPSTVTKLIFGPVTIGANTVGYVSPNSIVNLNLNHGDILNQLVTIISTVGPIDGQTVCIPLIFMDGSGRQCCHINYYLELPSCGCVAIPGRCEDRRPNYLNWGTNTAAFVTCGNVDGAPDPPYALVAFDLGNYQTMAGTANFPLGNRIQHSMMTNAPYHGPGDIWTDNYLGSIFGLTLDRRGNVFVAHSSMYKTNLNAGRPRTGSVAAPFGFGCILRVDTSTGNASVLAQLPNLQSTGTNLRVRPGIGNITYDYDNDYIYATNLEDGIIYQIPSTATYSGTANWTAWYAPFSGETPGVPGTGNGYVPYSGRIWGIQYHRGRLYFSSWVEDNFFTNFTPGADNKIWSVDVTGGVFQPSTLMEELTLPEYPVGSFRTFPASDISFYDDGRMAVSLMAMDYTEGKPTQDPHDSGVEEYICEGGKWHARGAYRLGPSAKDSAGGLDYDYDDRGGNGDRRIWCTGTYLNYETSWPQGYPSVPAPLVYGLAGFSVQTGGDSWISPPPQSIAPFPADAGTPNALLIDLDDHAGWEDKRLYGDVEIPCPSKGGVGGTVSNDNWPPPPNMAVLIRPEGMPAFERVIDIGPNGEFLIDNLDLVPTTIRFKAAKTLGKAHNYPLQDGPINGAQVNLVLGDIEDDNEINLIDYGRIAGAFGSVTGGANWDANADLDSDGEVNLADFGIFAGNFGMQGDD